MAALLGSLLIKLVLCFAISGSTALAAIPVITGTPNTGPFEYTGYIADRFCVNLRNAIDGADMLLSPQDHSLHCMVDIPACINNGYCLMQQDTSTAYWHCAHNFTQPQTLTIRDRIMALATDMDRANLLIRFNGSWAANGSLIPDIARLEYASSLATSSPSTLTTAPSTVGVTPRPPSPSAQVSYAGPLRAFSPSLLLGLLMWCVLGAWGD